MFETNNFKQYRISTNLNRVVSGWVEDCFNCHRRQCQKDFDHLFDFPFLRNTRCWGQPRTCSALRFLKWQHNLLLILASRRQQIGLFCHGTEQMSNHYFVYLSRKGYKRNSFSIPSTIYSHVVPDEENSIYTRKVEDYIDITRLTKAPNCSRQLPDHTHKAHCVCIFLWINCLKAIKP